MKKRDVTIEIHWGVTGGGKSYAAYAKYPDAYRKLMDVKWWDGYNGEDVVVLEEFNPGGMEITEFLRICDGYPLIHETKGSTTMARYTRLVFTTNYDPADWYRYLSNHNHRLGPLQPPTAR